MLLGNASGLTASFAENGGNCGRGHIYVGRPGHHFLIRKRRIELTHGPRENGFRPAVDPLFRTAGRNFGRRVVGVVLSGGLDDGTDGLRVINGFGGIRDCAGPGGGDAAEHAGDGAIQTAPVDHVAKIKEIARLLRHYASVELAEDSGMNGEQKGLAEERSDDRPDIAENGDAALRNGGMLGPPSMLTCPDCGAMGICGGQSIAVPMSRRAFVYGRWAGGEHGWAPGAGALWTRRPRSKRRRRCGCGWRRWRKRGIGRDQPAVPPACGEEFRQRAATIRGLLRRGDPSRRVRIEPSDGGGCGSGDR